MRSLHQPLPLTLVGGFLGSGKTSLLSHVVRHVDGRRVALLVDDPDEIGLPGELVRSRDAGTIELANGCTLAPVGGDLLQSVVSLFARDPLPESVVVEAAGVDSPAHVAQRLLGPATDGLVRVTRMIVLLDAETALGEHADYRDIAYDQLHGADVVVINKTDLVRPAQRADLREEVRGIAPAARIHETTFGELPLGTLLRESEAVAVTARPSRATPVDDFAARFASWRFSSDDAWSFGALQRAIERLSPDIFRAKGTVRLDVDGSDHGRLHLTGRRSWLTLSEPSSASPTTTELLFTGKPGFVTDETLRRHFEQALADSLEIDHRDSHLHTELRAFNVIFD